mgnify:CR=1 FL=1
MMVIDGGSGDDGGQDRMMISNDCDDVDDNIDGGD